MSQLSTRAYTERIGNDKRTLTWVASDVNQQEMKEKVGLDELGSVPDIQLDATGFVKDCLTLGAATQLPFLEQQDALR
jgi:hypothetical protein